MVAEVVGAWAILDVVGAGIVLKLPVVAGEGVDVAGAWAILDVVGASVVVTIPVVAAVVAEVVGAWAILDVVGEGVVNDELSVQTDFSHALLEQTQPCST